MGHRRLGQTVTAPMFQIGSDGTCDVFEEKNTNTCKLFEGYANWGFVVDDIVDIFSLN